MDPMYTDCLRELEQVKAERDALAAHVERLGTLWEALLTAGDGRDGAAIDLQDAFDDTPETSLAKLKAQWQAEALEELANLPRKWWPGELMIEANRIRRQAEGE